MYFNLRWKVIFEPVFLVRCKTRSINYHYVACLLFCSCNKIVTKKNILIITEKFSIFLKLYIICIRYPMCLLFINSCLDNAIERGNESTAYANYKNIKR